MRLLVPYMLHTSVSHSFQEKIKPYLQKKKPPQKNKTTKTDLWITFRGLPLTFK